MGFPDGQDISFSFEYERDDDGNIKRDKDGNANLTGITMTVTGKRYPNTNITLPTGARMNVNQVGIRLRLDKLK